MVSRTGRYNLKRRGNIRPDLWVLGAFLCGVWLLIPGEPAHSAALSPERAKHLRQQAEEHERVRDWEKACEAYETLIRLGHNSPELRSRWRKALRHYQQVRRHRDDLTYRTDILTLQLPHALRLYDAVVFNLLEGSLGKDKLAVARVFRKGLEEFANALDDPVFCRIHLDTRRQQDTRKFRADLQQWVRWQASIVSREQAVEAVRRAAMQALTALKLSPTVTVMEFACGACHAVDDYTAYLTPSQFSELADLLKGEYIGVGLQVSAANGRVLIVDIQEGSSAADPKQVNPPLQRGDLVLSIDKRPTATLGAETVVKMLEGEPGTTVELIVSGPNGMAQRPLVLIRRPILLRSVFYPDAFQSGAVAYLQLTCFQDTTLHELDVALVELEKRGMKALLLDLRGNCGGLFEVAVEVARRFLAHGVIASTEHQEPGRSMTYHAQNPSALTIPLVVLVDGETASAAEVLAGALKENGRARLVGQTTFGKGCLQEPRPLPAYGMLKVPPRQSGKSTGGLRVTVARFFSPAGHPYSGRGVAPHVRVERLLASDPMLVEDDQQLARSRTEALRLLDLVR